jgi:hypothetical protein
LQIYFQTIKDLKTMKEPTIDRMFQHISQVLESAIIDKDKFYQKEVILDVRLLKLIDNREKIL